MVLLTEDAHNAIEELGEFPIKTRVDLARVTFYRAFLEAKSADDVYFEHLLTTFLALAQQPLNFCVFQSFPVGTLANHPVPLFHFCNDKKHVVAFEESINDRFIVNAGEFSRQNLFPLFPSLITDYFISIHFMNTKTTSGSSSFSPVSITTKQFHPSDDIEYIGICATQFFSAQWDSFQTRFGMYFRDGLIASFEKLNKNHKWKNSSVVAHLSESNMCPNSATFPPSCELLISKQREVLHPNENRETWHETVKKIISPVLQSARFSADVLSGLMYHEKPETWPTTEVSPHPTNLLIAYRCFDRDTTAQSDPGRNSSEFEEGYPYNVRFLTEDTSNYSTAESGDSEVVRYFAFLGKQYGSNPQNYEDGVTETGHSPRIKRYLFRNFPSDADLSYYGAEYKPFLKALCSTADEYFWEVLKSDESGAHTCQNFLSTAIGNASRSMVDPVISTGLVHFNKIFESAGLDRISVSRIHDDRRAVFLRCYDAYKGDGQSAQDFFESTFLNSDIIGAALRNDLLRVVAFYYLFCGMAAGTITGRDTKQQYDIRNVTAVLSPIKLLGSVWGVSIHATFMDKLSFKNKYLWMYHFFLLNIQSKNLTYLIDKALWKNIENRVSRLIVKTIEAAFSDDDLLPFNKTDNGIRLIRALQEVNRKIHQEQQLVPYALPELKIFFRYSDQASDDSAYIWSCNLSGEKQTPGDFPQVRWRIRNNDFFVPRQPWNGRGTRRFSDSIEIGLRRGLAIAEAKIAASKKRNNR